MSSGKPELEQVFEGLPTRVVLSYVRCTPASGDTPRGTPPSVVSKEAHVVVNGVVLTVGQSLSLRVAVAHFLYDLSDAAYRKELGPIGDKYRERLSELQTLLLTNGRP